MKRSIVLSSVLFLMVSHSTLAEVAVIVHPSNADAFADKDVTKIFLGKVKTFPSGGAVLPLGRAEGAEVTSEFNSKVLDKSASQLKSYWSKLVFTGKGTPPKEFESDGEILQLVATNPNMIGFVDAGSVADNVRVVATF
ncbi:type 2 periplasmic-binding domain-containing protein [Teredinibacter purpureus]|uniref:phosphate ABC transporter substrate-binding protein n=1 Tax=Teredinibacter purpureus TaxID=2731756 RepID=UPI0005F84B90|nr:phosphate ABC transporter substrate-binding protein [Teredinibacter purpureus]